MTYVTKNCAACGDIIEVRLADHKRGWGRFCNKACSGAYKCGQRPSAVNEGHANAQGGHGWAADKLADFSEKYGSGGRPPKAPRIKDQVGRVSVKPIYHSPAECRECGAEINGAGLCRDCETHEYAMDAVDRGWDGHKAW